MSWTLRLGWVRVAWGKGELLFGGDGSDTFERGLSRASSQVRGNIVNGLEGKGLFHGT